MNVIKYLEDSKLTVAIEGRVDTITSPDLEKELVLDGVSELLLDFKGVEYISSAGLRVLVKAYKKLAAVGGVMKISGARPIVKEVFEITGFADSFIFE